MDALLAAAGPMASTSASASSAKPKRARKPLPHQSILRGKAATGQSHIDASLHSVLPQTRLSSSLHSSHNAKDIKTPASLKAITDKKLRAQLTSQHVAAKRSTMERQDAQDYLYGGAGGDDDGGIQVDYEAGERSWRVGQEEIQDAVGVASRGKRFDLKLETIGGGGYRMDYTKNGRHLAIASSHGHVSTFDWQAGRLHSEIQLGETVRDVKFLHSEAFYAVAQKKYVFIYDQNGVEIHKMKQHLDVTRMEFLPYHFLLSTIGNQGILRYHDTSTGQMVAEHKTRMGSVNVMAQNRHNAIIHLGHQNGQVTLWSPSQSTPHVKLLAHVGPLQSISIDPSASSCGRYMSTSGADGIVKVWDCRNWGQSVREWKEKSYGVHEVNWSMKGMLAVSGKGGVGIYRDLHTTSDRNPSLYQKIPLPSLTPKEIMFCPFEDVLGVGHDSGFSSLLVPGSGIAQFDSNEADVYESHSRHREREVRGVLEKIASDLITMDADHLGKLADPKKEAYTEKETPFYKKNRLERLQELGKAPLEEETEGDDLGQSTTPGAAMEREKLKRKMRGKNKSLSRYLRKKKKNVIDPQMVAAKEKMAKDRERTETERKVVAGEIKVETGALSRFK